MSYAQPQGQPPGVVKLYDVRLSYTKLFKPEAFEPGKPPQFSCDFLMEKGTEATKANLAALKEAKIAVMEEKWGKVIDLPTDKLCLKDGDKLTKRDGSPREETQGMWVLTAREREENPPVLLNEKAQPASPSSGKLYSGAYAHAIINLWCQDHKQYGMRLNANLKAVQHIRDGERFGGQSIDVMGMMGAVTEDSGFDGNSGADDDEIPF